MATDHARAWNRRRDGGQGPWKPPKLTGDQLSEITRRLADGETPMDLAAEYGVTASRIRSLR